MANHGPYIAGYVRVSSAQQRDESDSPANQRQLLQVAGCERIYQDLAVSGYCLAHRRAATDFARLSADIEARLVREVVAVRLDRLARRDQLVIELAELCQSRGVILRTLQGGVVDVSTASGWLSTKIHGVFGEHYSRALSDSIRGGFAALHARGIPARSARALPFHLEREPGTRHGVQASPHWPDARHTVERYLSGDWSTGQCAGHLYKRLGWRGTSAEWGKWCRRPSIAGHMGRRDGSIIIADCWPALVSAHEWRQLRDRLDRNRSHRKHAPDQPRLLSGVCSCALCGGKLAYISVKGKGSNLSRYFFLRCRRQGCVTRTISAPPIWEEILDRLDQRTAELVRLRATDAGTRQEPPEVAAWRRELSAREALPPELRQLADDRRVQELRGLLATAATVPDFAEDWWPDGLAAGSLQFWTGRPEMEINRDLRRLIDRAVVDPSTKQILAIHWRA